MTCLWDVWVTIESKTHRNPWTWYYMDIHVEKMRCKIPSHKTESIFQNVWHFTLKREQIKSLKRIKQLRTIIGYCWKGFNFCETKKTISIYHPIWEILHLWLSAYCNYRESEDLIIWQECIIELLFTCKIMPEV